MPFRDLKFLRSFSLLPFLAALTPNLALADAATSAAARNLFQKHQDALVVVTAVSTVRFTTDKGKLPDQDHTTQALGTLVHEKGLIMVSNSSIDFSVGKQGMRGKTAEDSEYVNVVKAESNFLKIQINLADGSEYNSSRVYVNEDMDLAFLLIDQTKIKERKDKLVFVDLANKIAASDLQIADEVVGLSRSQPIYGYIPSVIPGYVTAISRRDPTFYITTSSTAQGIPIFDLKGRFVGLTVQRIVEGKRTNILGTLAAGSVKTIADLAAGRIPQ